MGNSLQISCAQVKRIPFRIIFRLSPCGNHAKNHGTSEFFKGEFNELNGHVEEQTLSLPEGISCPLKHCQLVSLMDIQDLPGPGSRLAFPCGHPKNADMKELAAHDIQIMELDLQVS